MDSDIYGTGVWYQGESGVRDSAKKEATTRLKRVEGQVRGLLRMIEEDRYCIDTMTQISAVRAALHKVEELILRDHVSHCVADAFASGNSLEQRQKVDELVEAIGRMAR
jgi:CsoR family transcriptional regulator, copper-sensing transcriptional repressor